MGWLAEIVQAIAAAYLVRNHAGAVLLILAALGFPMTMWALHRTPRVDWRFRWDDVVSVGAILIYLLLIGGGFTIWWVKG